MHTTPSYYFVKIWHALWYLCQHTLMNIVWQHDRVHWLWSPLNCVYWRFNFQVVARNTEAVSNIWIEPLECINTTGNEKKQRSQKMKPKPWLNHTAQVAKLVWNLMWTRTAVQLVSTWTAVTLETVGCGGCEGRWQEKMWYGRKWWDVKEGGWMWGQIGGKLGFQWAISIRNKYLSQFSGTTWTGISIFITT